MLGFLSLKDWLYIGVVAALLGAFGWYTYHERHIGEAKIAAADMAARQEEDKKVAQQTAALQKSADQAAGERDATQAQLIAYMSTHPVGAVLVCHPNDSGAGVPQAADAGARGAGTRTGPAALPTVLAGGAGAPVDVGPELNTILQGAAAVAGLYRERQQVGH